MGTRIGMTAEDGSELTLEILEETTIQGVNYILVTDAPEGEDGECYIMKDVSAPEAEEAEEAEFEFCEAEEAETIMEVFAKLLSDEITIEV